MTYPSCCSCRGPSYLSVCIQTSLVWQKWQRWAKYWRRLWKYTGPWFSIKMLSYQYRKSHCGDKTVVRSSYLHNGISYTDKITLLYWIRALYTSTIFILIQPPGSHLGLTLFYRSPPCTYKRNRGICAAYKRHQGNEDCFSWRICATPGQDELNTISIG